MQRVRQRTHPVGLPPTAYPAALVGAVEAPDVETAIKKAIEEFDVTDPQQQKRLVALRRL
jgi:hypothetical protein